MFGSSLPVQASKPCVIPLPDSDHVVVHDSMDAEWLNDDPIALLVHGLGGSHRSGYMQRIARLLLQAGIRVLRMDLRGSGHGVALARRPYHAGCSDDVRTVIEFYRNKHPGSSIILAGFSLGGNIVLKLAGEASTSVVPGLVAVVSVAPPIDLIRCSELLALPRNRFYERYFLRELVPDAERRQKMFPDFPRVRFPQRMTLRLFDDIYTAPRNGFVDALDYYRRASSFPWIPSIRLPTLIMTSRDDPIIAVESFEALTVNSAVEVCIPPRGGHLGFLGWDGAGGFRWADRYVARWIVQQLSENTVSESPG